MTQYEIYVFLLCLIVFLLLTALSVACLYIITKLSVRLIRCGAEDEKIMAEQQKQNHLKKKKLVKVTDYILSSVLCVVFAALFFGSLLIRCTENSQCGLLPTYRVVNTGSMAKKHENNTYLIEDKLDDQIQTFDLIRTEKLPAEQDLQLYDIVVYEVDGMMVVHRIVGIEEPNERHPDCRYFTLQGDAVDAPDRFPVYYYQMRAIYRGERIPFIGSFILFMQSPAGWLCMLLIVVAMIASPLMDRHLTNERKARLSLIVSTAEPQPEPALTGGNRND